VSPGNPDFPEKAPPDRGASSFVYPASAANLRFFAGLLRDGGMVAMPTETVYGLAANALDPGACRAIFAVKGRPLFDPLIVHVADAAMAETLAFLPERFAPLAAAFWPGPLTLIVPKRPVVPDLVTAGKDTVALRLPRHPVARALLEQANVPLAAPSANPFGYVSPTRPEHVAESFGARVPFILDGGPCAIGIESTILDLSDPARPAILRPGAVTASAIAAVLGTAVQERRVVVPQGAAAPAPGTLERHYSPRSPLALFPEGASPPAQEGETVLLLKRPEQDSANPHIFWLSETGDPAEMAATLFTLLRQLDRAGYRRILCELPGSAAAGLAAAIRDRLLRAAGR